MVTTHTKVELHEGMIWWYPRYVKRRMESLNITSMTLMKEATVSCCDPTKARKLSHKSELLNSECVSWFMVIIFPL